MRGGSCGDAGRAAGPVLLLAYLAFVSLGLPDTVLGVAWPSLRRAYALPQSALGGALGAAVAGSFASGLAAGRLTGALGVGGVLALSTGLVALGLAGIALAASWGVLVACAGVIGLGSGAVDAALNGYAASHLSPRHVNWLHASYSAGATLGPVVMTAAVAGGSHRAGYAALAAALAAMALAFTATRGRFGELHAGGAPARRASARDALGRPPVRLLVATFLVYTGLEAAVGHWAFTVLRDARGLGVEAAGAWTSAYWGSIFLGRVAVGFAISRAGPGRLLRWGAAGALAGAALFALGPGAAGAAGLMLLGVSLAPVYPTLMSRTPALVGRDVAQHAVGFQVAGATLGVAVVPALHGALADVAGVGAIPAGLLALAAAFAGLEAAVARAPAAGPGPTRPPGGTPPPAP